MGKAFSVIAGLLIFSLVSVGIMVGTKTGFTIIDGWEIGVKKRGAEYLMTELKPGYELFIPVYEEIIEINGRPIMFNYSKSDSKKTSTDEIRYGVMIDGVDKNGIPIEFALAIEIKPIKDMMAEGYQEDGTFENMLDKKAIQPNKSIVRDVMAMFDAKTIQGKRDEVSKILNEKVTAIYKENKYFDLVGKADLKQIVLPKAVRDGQIAVQLAAQDAERSAELILKKENEAKAEVKAAEGRANAVRIEAQGRADAVLIEAEAKAKANNLVSKSITDKILRADTIEAWKSGGAQVPHLVGSEKSQYILPLSK